jgi:hypothetical protein
MATITICDTQDQNGVELQVAGENIATLYEAINRLLLDNLKKEYCEICCCYVGGNVIAQDMPHPKDKFHHDMCPKCLAESLVSMPN